VFFVQLLDSSFSAIDDASIDHQMHVVDLGHFLEENLVVVEQMVLDFYFIPFLTNPALGCILPEGALLNVIVP
jgi:hypothetical protein